MSKFIIQGSRPLKGGVRLGGAKNAGFKLIIAACLGKEESRILNLSYIGDVDVTIRTLKKLGLKVKECGEKTILVRPDGIKSLKLPQFAGEKCRASTLFAGMLLSKTGKAIIPLPGGCVLGARPINRHLEGFKSLGVQVKVADNFIYLKTQKLKGATFKFSKKSHTGTEAMLLAAVTAQGKTVIENAALEPEIDDMILLLNQMGAKIKRMAGEKIMIKGVKNLGGAIHQVMPDRNEAISYAIAALATKGDIVIENARQKDLQAFLKKLEEVGAKFEILNYGVRFWYEKQLKAVDVKTAPAPGFMTDWQPLWTLLMTQAKGESHIVEAVHNNRLQYTHELNKMGAKINLYNLVVKNPEKFYEFDNPQIDLNFHAAKIIGPTPLKAGHLKVFDLRAGATLTIAALIAKGRSIVENIDHIDRGYEKLDEKLRQLGAKIRRVE